MMREGEIDGEDFKYPHCNTEVLHAPGDCYYCDAFPIRQQARMKIGKPFSPLKANGWSGNVAVKAGEQHTHMGATYIVGSDEPDDVRADEARVLTEDEAQMKCGLPPFGWYCKKRAGHYGPCPTYPRWWTKLAFRLRRGFWA